ncbi:MAG: TlpA family protein disulfide reductase [Treponema sp.]|jgi:thiol-disulfide isomerase/thioredoxin|nr:TlpA family protein disulfide reductase [Treponema sp.]
MKLNKICALTIVLCTPCFFASAQSYTADIQAAFKTAGISLFEKKLPVTDFSLPLLNGNMVRLSSLRGKVVFLNFWATWCPPCRAEMPSMESLYQRFKEKGLEFLAVDLMEDRDDVLSFVSANKLSFPIAIDTDGRASENYSTGYIPTTFIIDKGGDVIAATVGGRNWNTPAVFAAFEILLKD